MDVTTLKKRALLLFLMLCLLPLSSACRTRTALPSTDSGQTLTKQEAAASQTLSSEALRPEAAEEAEETHLESGERGSRTRENPDAQVREYDENAPSEIVEGTDRLLHAEGEGSGSPLSGEGSEKHADQVMDSAGKTATLTVPSEEAEEMGVSADAPQAESAMTYFTVLLKDRMSSVFECQRANVYWETEEDHVTVYKTSPEHALILASGAYDVSSRLLPENLKVDDGWVTRKNPQVIVKIVDSSVLGSRAVSTDSAKAVYSALLARDGWSGMDAVRTDRVLLLSRELLEAPHLQTLSMLLIARTAHPDLFEDVDPHTALEMLSEEATGTLPSGLFFYSPSDR